MTIARGFPWLRYDPDVVGDPGRLLAPPYDVVGPAERERLAAEAEHQAIHVELPAGGDPERSAALLREWIEQGALEAGEVGMAVVQQRFVGPDGIRRTRTCVACEVELRDFEDGVVLPHERTFEAPRRTRVELMRATGANVSPVFLAYHDPERSLVDIVAPVTDEAADYTATDPEGTQTAVWHVTDLALLEAIEEAVRPHRLMVVDGHHRYTAALEYRDEVRAGGRRLVAAGGSEHDGPDHTSTSWHEGVLAMVCNSADPGMVVAPTHRIVAGIDPRRLDAFVVEAGALREQEHDDVESALAALTGLEVPGFVVVGGEGRPPRLLSVPDPLDLELAMPDRSDAYRSLDVAALHALVIDGGAVLADHARGSSADATVAHGAVSYTRSLDEALARVDAAPAETLAFLLREVPVERIHAVAEAGEVLPQKSTYFFPKVPTGVAYRPVDPALAGLG